MAKFRIKKSPFHGHEVYMQTRFDMGWGVVQLGYVKYLYSISYFSNMTYGFNLN